jgi:hypothetical protein
MQKPWKKKFIKNSSHWIKKSGSFHFYWKKTSFFCLLSTLKSTEKHKKTIIMTIKSRKSSTTYDIWNDLSKMQKKKSMFNFGKINATLTWTHFQNLTLKKIFLCIRRAGAGTTITTKKNLLSYWIITIV